MIKLLIVDDSEELREYLKTLLKNYHNLEIFEAKNFLETLLLCKKINFNIILLDLMLPDGNGSELCKNIRKNPKIYNNPFIIALTANTSQESINLNLELGCDDYIQKPFNNREFLIRLEKFIARVPVSYSEINYNGIKICLKNKVVFYLGECIDLSKNEFELLSYFLINKGLLLSRDTILNNVWKDNFEISEKAVDQCLKRLRKKLPLLNEFLLSKRGLGYILK